MEDMSGLIAVVSMISIVGSTAVYKGITTVWNLWNKDRREAEAMNIRIKQENVLRQEMAEANERVRQSERDYLEKQIKRLEDEIVANRDRYDNETRIQKKAIDTLDETYQRLVQSAQADKLAMENHIEQQQREIETLKRAYERSEKERTTMQEMLKETQAELRQAKEMILELKFDKVALERINSNLEQQLDVLRGLVEPVRLMLQKQLA